MGWLANFASSVWDAVCGMQCAGCSVRDQGGSHGLNPQSSGPRCPSQPLEKIKLQNSHSLAGCDSLIAGPGVGAGGL